MSICESDDRKVEIVYKKVTIRTYKGSNYAYIGKRIFTSVLSAKRHITKALKHFDGDIDLTCRFYMGVK